MSSSNSAARVAACDLALTPAQVSANTIDQIFARAYPGYTSSDSSWVDSTVLQAIRSSDNSQLAAASTTSQSSTTVTTTSTVTASSTASTTSSASLASTSSTTNSASSTTSSDLVSSTATGTSASATTSASVSSSGTSLGSTVTALTVATDGSAAYTDINAAVITAQISGIPTVSVLPGTYTALTITSSQTVTVVGPTASAVSNNQVVISANLAAGALLVNNANSKGVTFRNLNFTNTLASAVAPAVSMKGINMGFYTCALISAGYGVYSASYGISLISDSYIEGADKLFYNYPTVYLFRSTIVPTSSGSSIFYAKGASIGQVWYNATMIADSSFVAQKSNGAAVSNVYLATPNGANGYAAAIYKNTNIAGIVAAGGVYSTACSVAGIVFGEYSNTGSGAYSSNPTSRSANCDQSLSYSQVSAYTIDKVFGQAFSPYANNDTTWIDSNILAAISSAQAVASSSTTTTTQATSSASATTTSSTSTTSAVTCASITPGATLTVSKNATSCQYSSISSAIAALPNDGKSYTISIMAGVYTEQVNIQRNGKVTLIGETPFVNDYTQNLVTIQSGVGVLTSAGADETTPVIYAKKSNDNSGMALYNINFVNTHAQAANTAALAADFYGKNIAAYGCSFVGFQDTLLANMGTQVFKNCYIEGSIDFIWGFSTAYFSGCYIAANTKGGSITAQSRSASTVSGYVFDSCYVTYTSTYGSTFQSTYLGRPYSNLSTVVYMNSYLDKNINPAGWTVWSTSSPQTSGVTYGEYNNSGPGSWQTGTARASFATNLTATQAAAYSLSNWIGDTSFIDQAAWNYQSSYSWPASNTTSNGTATGTSSGSTTTASVNAHPDSGTTPPNYSVLVSPNGQVNGSFSNLTAALASLPQDNTNQTVFIYAGVYNEQVPSINRPGATRIIGYTTGNPGQSYKDNQVTVSFSRGLSVSPLPTGHSDAETAVVSTASNRISFYNINIVNTDNLNGLESSYVTLAVSIYGNDIGFYACSFDGWQDTMLNGATTGYQYYESCYIGGAIDYVWGYSKAYFKGCTLGSKRAGSCVTAQSRASSSAIGGYIFDQCLFTAAPDATVDLDQLVYLGRPYSQYALVVVKNSYLDSVIQPSGWKIWSATDPRTNFITFAEYNNSGPGNWQNNAAARQAFGNATLLTSDTYSLASVMDNTEWIDSFYWDSIVTPQPAIKNTTSSSSTGTVSGNSTFDGTVPPKGALIVSKNPIAGVTVYGTIQAALDAAPTTSSVNATIFIYPGVYEEKLILNKSGSTIFRGYSSATSDYSENQVTIQQSFGVDTQGTGSDVDAATVYATGNYFFAYNINFRNNNGTQQNIASLGFAVKSSKYAFMHACQIYGNQDTLYISGNLFTFKSYIVGNVDFIFGAGSGYFLSSTISPNEDKGSITASKRTSNTTQAGFVFDQSNIVPVSGGTGFTNVSLGRPWNQYARVAYIGCYLDAMIGAAGWDQWSKSSPNTDGVTFVEYHNTGPGSNVCNRASFSAQLDDSSVVPYELSNFFTTLNWIDFSVVDVQPFNASIGSAPAACASTTSSVPISTSTTISTTPISAPITVFKTKTITDKLTATITTILDASTTTSTMVITEDDGVTVTPAPVVKTSTIKSTVTTATTTSTTTSAAKAVTVQSTTVVTATTTVTGKATTMSTTVTDTTTVDAAPATTTVKSTITSVATTTSTQKPVTITSKVGTTATTTVTQSPKAVTVTSTSTVPAATTTKTTSVKASTITVDITSWKTTTKSTTVTAACTTTQAPALRFRRHLIPRAAGTITETVNVTVSTIAATSVVTLKGSLFSTVVTSTSSIYPTTTLKAATTTVVSTAITSSTDVVTETAPTATITSFATTTALSTITEAGATTTVTDTVTSVTTQVIAGVTTTSTAFKTATTTLVVPATTVTNSVTSTSFTTTVVAAQTTLTTTITSDTVITTTTTIPAATSTVVKTSSAKAVTDFVTVTPAPVSKTSTIKSTSTVFATVTKAAKC
ncbi:carbohydrate esterase family 8 protein [Myriangium duriaei CBS 260.36]|uniref:pectinesterase n=1 Tax=Myriangium duriaei CBS 260.36 TaxID=1168546 RepID=A0A9P4ISB2_9PEZI|nr:carbohydrate esterase family 8 protein [Myriangium duriaei CBS 260.36]